MFPKMPGGFATAGLLLRDFHCGSLFEKNAKFCTLMPLPTFPSKTMFKRESGSRCKPATLAPLVSHVPPLAPGPVDKNGST